MYKINDKVKLVNPRSSQEHVVIEIFDENIYIIKDEKKTLHISKGDLKIKKTALGTETYNLLVSPSQIEKI